MKAARAEASGEQLAALFACLALRVDARRGCEAGAPHREAELMQGHRACGNECPDREWGDRRATPVDELLVVDLDLLR